MKEITFNKKKKNNYPSKVALNLYYKEDKTTRPATIALYVLFIAVVILALGKLLVYDKLQELEAQQAILARTQSYYDSQLLYLADYQEVSSQYARYSYSYLSAEEQLQDRLEILEMLEDTVFAQATIDNVSISADVVSLTFSGLNLENTAALAKRIETYKIVEKVEVNTSALHQDSLQTEDDSNITTAMVITLKAVASEENEAGGEQ